MIKEDRLLNYEEMKVAINEHFLDDEYDAICRAQDAKTVKLLNQQWIEEIEKIPRTKDRGLEYMFMTVGLWREIKSKMEADNEKNK